MRCLSGLPKPAIVTFLRTSGISAVMNSYGVCGNDIIYTALPLYHTAAGLMALGATILNGNGTETYLLNGAFRSYTDCIMGIVVHNICKHWRFANATLYFGHPQ